MRIEFVHGLGRTPARVNRRTGTIFLNSETWDNYTEFEKKLIILHEKAHYLLQTTNEQEADAYAVEQFIGSEFESLKKSLQSFYSTLDMSNPAHRDRYKAVLRRIIQTDYYKFGNYKLLKILYRMYEQELQEILIAFLNSKGIKSLEGLSQTKKDALMTEFMQTPQVVNLLAHEIQAEVSFYSDFSSFKGKVQSKIGNTIGGVFGNVDKANKAADKSTTEAGKMLIGGNVKNPTVPTMIEENVKNPTVPTMIGGNVKNPTVTEFFPAQNPPAPIPKPIWQPKDMSIKGIQERIKAKADEKIIENQQKAQEAIELRDSLRANAVLAQEQMSVAQEQYSVAQKATDNSSGGDDKKITAEKKKKTMLYIGIGAGVIVVAVVLFFVLRKK